MAQPLGHCVDHMTMLDNDDVDMGEQPVVPVEVSLPSGTETRSVATQSTVTYTSLRHASSPRFQVLGEEQQGAFFD